MSNLPVIAGVEIFVDRDGRYNLNALHKAYERDIGKTQVHKRPSKWLALDSAVAFIDAVTQTLSPVQGLAEPVEVIRAQKGGSSPGTFAHELIAVEYAGWISPKFRILVNQTFIDYRTGKLQPQPPQSVIQHYA
jgi:hypothetical protein